LRQTRCLRRPLTGAAATPAPNERQRAHAAGDEGIEGSYGEYEGIGWSTWRRLLDYKWGPLVEERGRLGTYRVRITAAGRVLYERECARYLELYPRVGVIQPRAALGH